MNAVSLNNLWNYLKGLSLTGNNKRWLGERLIEASKEQKRTRKSGIEQAYDDVKAGRVYHADSVDDMFKQILNAHRSHR